jgi:hypothetical protein
VLTNYFVCFFCLPGRVYLTHGTEHRCFSDLLTGFSSVSLTTDMKGLVSFLSKDVYLDIEPSRTIYLEYISLSLYMLLLLIAMYSLSI